MTKAISVRQPWAWLIVNADSYTDPKRLENRNWKTKHRGPILIHASQGFDKRGYESVISARPDLKYVMPLPAQFERGGIVGQAEIVDVVSESDSAWFVGKHGFVLERAMRRPFVSMKGKLSFFEVDAEPLPYEQQDAPRCDANVLERMAIERPDDFFIKGSGVLKLIGAIRDYERQIADLKAKAAPNLVMASLEQMGQVTTKDSEDQPSMFYPYAVVLGFSTVDEIKKALDDGSVNFAFKD